MRFIIFILAIISTASCKNNSKEIAVETPKPASETRVSLTAEQMTTAGIEVGKPEMKSIYSLLKLNGKIDVPPQNMVSVSFPLGGYLKSTKLLPGMHVRKGEVIGVLEDAQYIQLQQDYLSTKIRLQFLEQELARQKELNESKAASDKVYQQAQSDYASQKVMMKSLSEKLSLIGINAAKLSESNLSKTVHIYSPINGFVSKVFMNIGRYISPTDVLFELVNPDDIHLNLNVFEKDISRLKIGQKVWAYTTSNPSKKYQTEIILISKDITDDRTAEVHCHFEQYDKSLIPGMYMNAEVETTGDNVVAVPEGAIVRYENKQYVFVAKGDRSFEMTPIETGNTENGFTEISGSASKDFLQQNLALKNAYTLLMKMKNKAEEE